MHPHHHVSVRRVRAIVPRLGALVLAWSLALGCAPTPDPVASTARAEPLPVGDGSYDEALSQMAGLPLSGRELARDAGQDMERLEAEAAEVARQIGDGTATWRELLADAVASHPEDAAAVLAAYRREIERSYAWLAERDLVTLPADGPSAVEVVEIQNPIFQRYFSLAMYLDGRLAVTARPAEGGAESGNPKNPYLKNHCHICIPPLAVHEIFPGHHVAYRRAEQAVPDEAERRLLNRRRPVYHEGWALYVEGLMLEQGYYEDPLQRLGALRLIYLRSLRALIDPELHGGRLGRDEAEALYVRDGLLTAEAARAEVDRHLKDPGLKASYFLGARWIFSLRDRWLESNPEASLKIFHDRLLGKPEPLPEIARERFAVDLSEPHGSTMLP